MASRGEPVGSYPRQSGRMPSPALSAQIDTALAWCEARLANAYLWAAAISCIAVLQAALIATHWPWSDEWQALLIARDTPTIASMLEQLHYEGHPQLWYLLLRTVGSVANSAWVFAIVNALLAAITWWAILARSPFRRVERLLLVTNEILLFEMLTVSRSMTLGVAILFLALALWRSRFAWIAIALLPLCDFFFGVIACALIALRFRDREDERFPYIGITIFCACSLAAAIAVIPAHDIVTTPTRGWLTGFVYFCRELGTLAFPWQTDLYDTPLPVFAGIVLAPAFLFVCAESLRNDRLARFSLYGFLGLLLLFACAVYPMYLRHTALAAILLIAFVWIGALKEKPAATTFNAWLSAAALCGLATSAVNLLLPFDTAAQAATVIRQQKLERKLWFSYPTFQTLALTGESGIPFGDLERDCAIGFMRWNFQSRIETHIQFYAKVREAEARHGSFYLVTNVPLPPVVGQSLAIVPAGNDGVQYRLWKVGTGAAANANLPLCAALSR